MTQNDHANASSLRELAQSNSKSEDIPIHGFICKYCSRRNDISEPPQDSPLGQASSQREQDTSLDDIIEELVVDTFEDVILVQVEDKIKAKRKIQAWHKAETAKLFEQIRSEAKTTKEKKL